MTKAQAEGIARAQQLSRTVHERFADGWTIEQLCGLSLSESKVRDILKAKPGACHWGGDYSTGRRQADPAEARKLAAEGKTRKEIARALGVSVSTVRLYLID